MSIIRISRWLNKFRKYFFTYRDGYFDLPYLSNSPDLMVESFKRMPFTRYDGAANVIYTNNMFTDGAMYFCELEEGLWIMQTEMEFKKNVSTNALYDNEPCDYHFLSYFIYNSLVNRQGFNGVTIPIQGWGFYKPGTEIKAYFNKGDTGIFTDFVFNKAWFERHIPLRGEHDFKPFLESGDTYKTWENMVPGSEMMIREILSLLKTSKPEESLIPLKIICLKIISQFFISISTTHPLKPHTALRDNHSRLVARTENVLLDKLTTSFPGIDELAQTLNTSPTKLATAFKTVHNNSIYQYYQQKQMELALEMLKTSGMSVKSVAITLGYQSPGKFSAAFKKYHQVLPSEIKQPLV